MTTRNMGRGGQGGQNNGNQRLIGSAHDNTFVTRAGSGEPEANTPGASLSELLTTKVSMPKGALGTPAAARPNQRPQSTPNASPVPPSSPDLDDRLTSATAPPPVDSRARSLSGVERIEVPVTLSIDGSVEEQEIEVVLTIRLKRK